MLDDYDALDAAIDGRTKAVFLESIGNPAGNIVDIERIAAIAHRHGVPVIVDNTVATPYLCRPFDFGADVVVHSLTKYIGGRGTTIGGMIVDSGRFDLGGQQGALPRAQRAGPGLSRRHLYRGTGTRPPIRPRPGGAAAQHRRGASPHSAFLILQGLETLGLRMDRHCENAQKVAEYLQGRAKVRWVSYGGLPDSPYHALARKITRGKASGILSFGIEGGKDAGARFINTLQMILRLVNIGDAKSLACHRHRPRIANSIPRNWRAPASRKIWCASRWGSSISTTSSPTSNRRWPRCEARPSGPPPFGQALPLTGN